MSQNIVITGFMGSGKSMIARRLAKILNRETIDSDFFIQNATQKSINDIFTEFGEAHFRDLERKFIEKFSREKNLIISTGGGMPIFNDTRILGQRFYLSVSFYTIFKRIERKNHRPLFANHADPKTAREAVFALYKSRQKIYAQECEVKINANNSIKNILHAITSRILV